MNRALLATCAFVISGVAHFLITTGYADSYAQPFEFQIGLECGGETEMTARFRASGHKCTAGSDAAGATGIAIGKANEEFVNGFACDPCWSSDGCTKTVTPASPFESADCAVTVTSGCQGNPLKTLYEVDCVKHLTVNFSCSECPDEPPPPADPPSGSGHGPWP